MLFLRDVFVSFFSRFFALLHVYLIAGILIKRYKMGVDSVPEVLPNFEFWAGIPSLVLALECEFLGFENWNTAHGIRNPTNDWIPESST